jgi:uncharacterized protein (TIGR02271 family)
MNTDPYKGKRTGEASTPTSGSAGYGTGAASTGQTGQAYETYGGTDYSNLIGYEVIDRNSNSVGMVNNLWTDEHGQPAFLGIDTGWIMSQIHVVPVHTSDINHRKSRIRLPFAEATIRDAPSFDPEAVLNEQDELTIYRHYSVDPQKYGLQSSQTGYESGATTGTMGKSSRSTSTTETHDDRTIPLSEEQLKVSKRDTGAGGVRLRKIVRTETVQKPVELKREDIVVERVPASEVREGATKEFSGEDIFVPLRREEAVVEKQSHVREGVRVGKRVETEHRDVSGTVRKEDIEVDRGDERRAA